MNTFQTGREEIWPFGNLEIWPLGKVKRNKSKTMKILIKNGESTNSCSVTF